jgi:hypothetical protein
MRRNSWTDREGPAISRCIGRGKAGPLISVLRLPFLADDRQTKSNAGTELALWEV